MPARRAITVLLVCLWTSVLGLASNLVAGISLSDYAAELNRLSAAVEGLQKDPSSASAVARSLPPQWTVQAEGRTFRVSTEALKSQLEKMQKEPSSEVARELQARIAALKTGAEEFAQPPKDAASYRSTLDGILSRREFRNVHGPTWWDLLKQKLARMLIDLLERIFGSSSFPVVSRVLVWGLIVAAVAVLALWIFRTIRRNARLETILPEALPVSAKQWPVWMAEARAAAEQGRWRDAIHLAYWAGISFLEERGTWRPDRARTPREYLQLLGPASQYRATLSALTRQFEIVWYGYQEAGPDSFAETLLHLESLGCRSN